jgi:carbon monoxide dehydrogenase subunit G
MFIPIDLAWSIPVELQHAFDVPATPERVWETLLDVERVAVCMPGAELTEVVGDDWRGNVNVKFGPVALSFAGTITVQQRDDEARRLILHGKGREQRGKGAASAMITMAVLEQDGGSRVSVDSDINLSGTVVQVSRGMLPDISARMMEQFAKSLRAMMAQDGAAAAARLGTSDGGDSASAATPPAAALAAPPVSGLRLGLWALGRMLMRSLRRLLRRKS